MTAKKTNKPTLRDKLAATDTREPQTKVVTNAIRRLPKQGTPGFTVQVLANGLGVIRRMARKGASKGSIAHSLGISLEKFNDALREQPEVMDALTAGLAGLEDELCDILLYHARNKEADAKTSAVAAMFLSKARFGWRDQGETRENNSRPNLMIVMPGTLSMEDWQQTFANYQQAKGQPK